MKALQGIEGNWSGRTERLRRALRASAHTVAAAGLNRADLLQRGHYRRRPGSPTFLGWSALAWSAR